MNPAIRRAHLLEQIEANMFVTDQEVEDLPDLLSEIKNSRLYSLKLLGYLSALLTWFHLQKSAQV